MKKNKLLKTTKFMQTLSIAQYNGIQKLAEPYGMSVQDYIRFMLVSKSLPKTDFTERVKKGWETRRAKKNDKLPANPPPWETPK